MHLTPKCPDLIFDVGMQLGEDTDFYLKKGFRVVGFEADPDLARRCRQRFAKEIGNSRLVIVEGAIVDPENSPSRTVTFYRNEGSSQWGTVAPTWAKRNELLGTESSVITVQAVDFADCVRQFGVPHYLKVDIEGMDMVCVRALKGFSERPDYISIESDKLSFEALRRELDTFRELGYDSFKAVQQNGVPAQREPQPPREGRFVGVPFPEGATGLFGADLPGPWVDYSDILSQYRFIFLQYKLFGDYGVLRGNLLGRILRRVLATILRKPVPGWYDTHARHAAASYDE